MGDGSLSFMSFSECGAEGGPEVHLHPLQVNEERRSYMPAIQANFQEDQNWVISTSRNHNFSLAVTGRNLCLEFNVFNNK